MCYEYFILFLVTCYVCYYYNIICTKKSVMNKTCYLNVIIKITSAL